MAIDPNLLLALLSQVPQVGDDEVEPIDPFGVDPVAPGPTIPYESWHGADLFSPGETGGDLEGLFPGRSSVPSDFFGGRPGLDRKVGEEWVPRLPSRQPLEWTHDNQGGWHGPNDRRPYEATDFAQYGNEGPFAPHWSTTRELEGLMGIRRTGQDIKGWGPPGAGWHEKQYLAGPEHEYERRKYNDEGMARVRRSARREELRNDPELLQKSISWSPEQLEEYLNWRPESYDLLDRTNEQEPYSDLNRMQNRKWRYGGKDVRVEWVNGKPTMISVEGGREGERKEPWGSPGPLPRIPRGLETLF